MPVITKPDGTSVDTGQCLFRAYNAFFNNPSTNEWRRLECAMLSHQQAMFSPGCRELIVDTTTMTDNEIEDHYHMHVRPEKRSEPGLTPCADHAPAPKPDPEYLVLVAGRMRLKTNDCEAVTRAATTAVMDDGNDPDVITVYEIAREVPIEFVPATVRLG